MFEKEDRLIKRGVKWMREQKRKKEDVVWTNQKR